MRRWWSWGWHVRCRYEALVEVEMLLLSLNVALFLTAFLYLRWYSIIAAKQIARF